MIPPRHLLRVIAVLVIALAVVAPSAASAGNTQEERKQVQRKQAELAKELDTIRATDAEVERALAALQNNVATQRSALAEAERKAAAAEAALAAAQQAVLDKQYEIQVLTADVRDAAVAAFISPEGDGGIVAAIEADTVTESEVRSALLAARTANQLDILDQLTQAKEDLAFAEDQAQAAAVAAEANRAEVTTTLERVTEARDAQATLAANVQARLDRKLSEAAGLAALDKELAGKIAAEQARLAAQVPKTTSRGGGGAAPITITGSGSIVSVRGIRVHKSIADQTARMLQAAENDGISLSGGGYRSSDSQIALRRAHCGTSNYDVYQKSPSQCRPPTARPGQSNHERGLAIDFTYNGRIINSRSSPAFKWLKANAAGYGFYNLPSEPWHWSVNGN